MSIRNRLEHASERGYKNLNGEDYNLNKQLTIGVIGLDNFLLKKELRLSKEYLALVKLEVANKPKKNKLKK
jgi:hypothetical protein